MQTSFPMLPRASATPKFGRLQLNFGPVAEGPSPPPYNPADYRPEDRATMKKVFESWQNLFIPTLSAKIIPGQPDHVEFKVPGVPEGIIRDTETKALRATVYSHGWRPIPGSDISVGALMNLGEDKDFTHWRDAHIPGALENSGPGGINSYKTIGEKTLSPVEEGRVDQLERKLPSVSFYYQLDQRLAKILTPQQREQLKPLLPLLYGIAYKIKASTGRIYPFHDFLTKAFREALPQAVPANKIKPVANAVFEAEDAVEKNLYRFQQEVKEHLPEVLSELTVNTLLHGDSIDSRSFEGLRDKVSRDQFFVRIQQDWHGNGVGFAEVLPKADLEQFRVQ